jgi:hypothetical protein
MLKKTALLLGVALAAFLLGRLSVTELTRGTAPPPAETSESRTSPHPSRPPAESAVAQAYRQKRSDLPVQGEGRIIKSMPDDTRGSRHQRLLIAMPDGQSVLIVHNIDLAPRLLDPQQGETIAFKGEYVWNAKGGLVHWTHHDPAGRHPGGWLEYRGKTYQ